MRFVALAMITGLSTGACSIVEKPEICSVIVSKEDGYKKVCQRGNLFHVQSITGSTDALFANHAHLATSLVKGRIISISTSQETREFNPPRGSSQVLALHE